MSEGGAPGRLRIYVDTSVIGGCLDREFESPSRRLFRAFMAGRHVLVLSEVTAQELALAPEAVQEVVRQVPDAHKENHLLGSEARHLSELYLGAGVLPRRMWSDAQHIAVATLADVDVLVSWNFKHVVNLRRIRGYNAVNAGMGYRQLEIRTPVEVLGDEDE